MADAGAPVQKGIRQYLAGGNDEDMLDFFEAGSCSASS